MFAKILKKIDLYKPKNGLVQGEITCTCACVWTYLGKNIYLYKYKFLCQLVHGRTQVDICPYGTFLCYQWNWIRLDESFSKSYHLLFLVKIDPAYECNEFGSKIAKNDPF